MNTLPSYKKTAYVITAVLIVILLLSLLWIGIGPHLTGGADKHPIAEVYQNGNLLFSVDLSAVTEETTRTITGENGCTNELLICPGKICIQAASCPDKLCVKQGFLSDSHIPITCLPNSLVIRIQYESEEPDGITY